MSLQERFENYKRFSAAESILMSGGTFENLMGVDDTDASTSPKSEQVLPENKRLANFQFAVRYSGVKSTSQTLEREIQPLGEQRTESPFDKLDQMLDDEKKFKRLIKIVEDELILQFTDKLVARLHFLWETAKEEWPEEVPIAPESLKYFISFLRKIPSLKYPEVVLTPTHDIRAQWRVSPNRHFAVEFLPNGETQYVIFSPNQFEPDRVDRLSGITTVNSLINLAEYHGVHAWALK